MPVRDAFARREGRSMTSRDNSLRARLLKRLKTHTSQACGSGGDKNSSNFCWSRPAPFHRLPKTRQRPITPPPSHESSDEEASFDKQTSPFFLKLPLEIRRKILREAFGDGSVHMDLIFSCSCAKCRNATGQGHGNLASDATRQYDVVYPRMDWSGPKQWVWRGSTCHRNPPTAGLPGHRVLPAADTCRFGRTPDDACRLWPGTHPNKCRVGAMGWLTSCRQAYVEGVDVLYSTNTFHTASKEMLINLHRLLLPQRLSSIMSFEILWTLWPEDLYPTSPPGDPLATNSSLRSLRLMLKAIPTLFPNLRSLYFSIQSLTFPNELQYRSIPEGQSSTDTTDETFVRPFEDMVRSMPPSIEECSLALPSSLYVSRRTRAQLSGARVERACDGGNLERHWCPLETEANSLQGYWINLGFKDMARSTLADETLPHSPSHEENMVLYNL